MRDRLSLFLEALRETLRLSDRDELLAILNEAEARFNAKEDAQCRLQSSWDNE